jgi:CRISPR/Cas system-associated endonuclease/helicase Cas3
LANPQVNQFTKLSNELFEAIMQSDFSKRQRNILDLVIRMSYGCGKKIALLRLSVRLKSGHRKRGMPE